MPDYDEYLMRHSENWLQFIVEQIEHVEGIVANKNVPLEHRWAALAFRFASEALAA